MPAEVDEERPTEAPEVSVGEILRRAFEALRAQPLAYALLAGLGVLSGVLVGNANPAMGRAYPVAQATVTILVGGSALLVAHLAIAYGVVSHLRGTTRSAPEMLSAAILRLPSASAAFLLGGLAVLLSSAFVVVPGVMVFLTLLPMGAVAVFEGRGPIDTLRATGSLTRGHRLTLFYVWMVVMLGWLVSCFGVVGCMTFATVVSIAEPDAAVSPTVRVFILVANVAHSMTSVVMASVVSAASHHVLSRAPRSPGPLTF